MRFRESLGVSSPGEGESVIAEKNHEWDITFWLFSIFLISVPLSQFPCFPCQTYGKVREAPQ